MNAEGFPGGLDREKIAVTLFAFSLELVGPEPAGESAGVPIPGEPAINVGDCSLRKAALRVEYFGGSLSVLALTSG